MVVVVTVLFSGVLTMHSAERLEMRLLQGMTRVASNHTRMQFTMMKTFWPQTATLKTRNRSLRSIQLPMGAVSRKLETDRAN